MGRLSHMCASRKSLRPSTWRMKVRRRLQSFSNAKPATTSNPPSPATGDLQMKNSVALALSLLLLGATAGAQTNWPQTATGAKSDKRAGVISGRLTDTTGQPLINAVVYIGGAGYLRRESRNISTDEQGRFRVADLPRRVYYVSLNVPGYVMSEEETGRRMYRTGDTVNLIMAKGGAITGTVMNHTNQPMTRRTVQA